MSKASTKTRSIRISNRTRARYKERDPRLDQLDAPQLPPGQWANGVVGKYYRPIKSQISLRVDNDVLAWLKSRGPDTSAGLMRSSANEWTVSDAKILRSQGVSRRM